MKNKPLALLATPRCGSTPVYRLLTAYTTQNFGTQGVSEILHPSDFIYSDLGNSIGLVWDSNKEFSKNRHNHHYFNARLQERFELVKKYHGKIFFKIFPHVMNAEISQWIFEHYEVIPMERRDLFEQALSYLISVNSGLWYEDEGINIAPQTLTAKESQFRVFERFIAALVMVKQKEQLETKLFYEDFVAKPAPQFLSDAGFSLPFDESEIKQSIRQNNAPKLPIFTNADDIQNWYQNSMLQQMSPLKDNP